MSTLPSDHGHQALPPVVTHTRAAVLEATASPLVIRNIELPPLEPGQVLVQVAYSGVCRSQLMEVRGGRGEDRWLPHLLGHEGAGTVLQVGAGVRKVAVGDEVILGWVRAEGMDPPGARYRCQGRDIHSGRVTTFSHHTIVAESRVVPRPRAMPSDVSVLFGCALPTGAGMVLNELSLAPGSRVVVLGLGGIGFGALLALKSVPNATVIAVDVSAQKLALAREFGAHHTIDASHCDPVAAVMELVPGGVDACVESAGSTESIETGLAMVRKGGGQLLFASHPPEGQYIRLAPHDLISGKRIAGSWGGASRPDVDVPRLAALLQQWNAPLHKLLSHTYPLDQINTALDDLEAGRVFRPLIVMDHGLQREFP